MFENFKFKQLEGLQPDQAQLIISSAEKEAYQAPSYWIKNALAFLLAPLVLLQLYFAAQSQPQMLNSIVTTLPRYLLLAVCFYFLVRRTKRANA